jgi:hypothetical protein
VLGAVGLGHFVDALQYDGFREDEEVGVRDVDGFARVVWHDSERGESGGGNGSVKFCKLVRTAGVSLDDYHWSEPTRFGFPIHAHFDPGVPDEDEVALLEVEIFDCATVFLLEFFGGGEPGFEDALLHVVEVLLSLSELSSADGNEFRSCHFILRRNHVRDFGKVKGEKGFYAVRHIIRGTTEALLNRYSFRPKDGMRDCVPFVFLAVARLHDCFSDVEMSALDRSVGLGVVGGDPNVCDAVFVGQPIEGLEEGLSVVGDDFFQCAPTAQEILEDKCA